MTVYVIEGINPEPWMAAEASVGRRRGGTFVRFHTPEKYASYKRAVREAMAEHYRPIRTPHPIILFFYFWRSTSDGGQPADSTNLQKGLEDALAPAGTKDESDWTGLFVNDVQVMSIHTNRMEQGTDVDPLIVIEMKEVPDGIERMKGAGVKMIDDVVAPVLADRRKSQLIIAKKPDRLILPQEDLF